MRLVFLPVILVFIILVVSADSAQASQETPVSRITEQSLHRQIQYSFILRNTRNTVLPGAELRCYAPAKKTSWQNCISLNASHAFELKIDDYGNQILCFSFSDLPPFASKIIRVRSDIKFNSAPDRLTNQGLETFLKSERYVESDHSAMVKLARNLKGADQLQTVRNIFRWVSGNVENTGYLWKTRGAVYALKQRKGDCTEFMCLFVALCRACDIPARGIGGYICSGNGVLKPADYHNWAEFYYNGIWRIADPQRKILMQDESRYVVMKIFGTSQEDSTEDFNRFRAIGDGLKVVMD